MNRIISIITAIFVIVIFITGLGNVAIAQCKNYDYIKVNNDSELPVLNSSFDPCDTELTWKVSFTRNSVTINEDNAILEFQIHGRSDVNEEWVAGDYDPDDYEFSRTFLVGQSSEERLYLAKQDTSLSVHFESIMASAKFASAQPD